LTPLLRAVKGHYSDAEKGVRVIENEVGWNIKKKLIRGIYVGPKRYKTGLWLMA
jgi:hypothetical protein